MSTYGVENAKTVNTRINRTFVRKLDTEAKATGTSRAWVLNRILIEALGTGTRKGGVMAKKKAGKKMGSKKGGKKSC